MTKWLTNTRGTRKSNRGSRHATMALAAVAVFLLFLMVAPTPKGYAAKGDPKTFLLQSMDFGEFVATASSGTVILSSTGSATYSGVIATGGAVLTAEFEVRGKKFATFQITLPNQIVIPGASGDMIIDNFTSNPTDSGVFNAQGKAYVSVGATMNMTDLMTSGLYSSSFDITFTIIP